MKNHIIAIAMLLTLGTGQTVMAQGQPPKDGHELVDTTMQDSVEAFSDTTDVADSTVVSRHHRIGGYSATGNSIANDIFGNIGIEGMKGMAFVLAILVIIFVIAPVVILAVLFFFIYKSRKQKMKLAQMAMQNGQPIPDQLLDEHRDSDDELRQKGIRQTFLGVGLLAFFGYVGSTLGIGIGILVTVIGLGKLAIVKTNNKQ